MTIHRANAGSGANGRVRRAMPERAAPQRQWPRALRAADSWQPPTRMVNPSAHLKSSATKAKGDGVGLGYQVLEKHMRRASSIAPKSKAVRKAEAGSSIDLQDLVERLARGLAEAAPVFSELINRLGRVALGDDGRSGGTSGLVNANSRVAIEVNSPRPVRVNLELRPEAERRPLKVYGLYAPGAGKPTIRAVKFVPSVNGTAAALRIRLPRLRGGAAYSGLLVDPRSGEPMGIVSVRAAR